MIFKIIIYTFALCGLASCSSGKATKNTNSELQAYLQSYPQVSQEDAMRRLSPSHKQLIDEVYQCAQQTDGYAGFVIRHTPKYEIESYFKGSATQKLKGCTANPIFKAIDTKHSQEELFSVFEKVKSSLNELNIKNYAELYLYGHKVEVDHTFGDSEAYISLIVENKDVDKVEALVGSLVSNTVVIKVIEGNPEVDVLVEAN